MSTIGEYLKANFIRNYFCANKFFDLKIYERLRDYECNKPRFIKRHIFSQCIFSIEELNAFSEKNSYASLEINPDKDVDIIDRGIKEQIIMFHVTRLPRIEREEK